MTLNRNLQIKYRKVSNLKPYGGNARTHSEQQIKQLAESIKTFGWTNPILIDEGLTVLAGHGRLFAAQQLGLDKAPTIMMSHLTDVEKKAYILADNKLAENAAWDHELLALEIDAIAKFDVDFDFNVAGFAAAEIDSILSTIANDNSEVTEDTVTPSDEPPISRRGDLWILGDHRLYCGDATLSASYDQLMDGQRATMAFTDPPYNVPIGGFVSGNGSARHKEFAMASGEMSNAEFTAFLKGVIQQMAMVSTSGALHYICMDWRHMVELTTAAKHVYSEQKNLCVWNKTNAGMGSFYRSKHELVFIYKVGQGSAINNIELGKHGRNRTNVWDYPGANGFSKTRDDDLALHPTVKPIAMVADAIKDASQRGDVILDPFAGSGTIILAAEQTGRKAAAIEIEPSYVDTAIKRFETTTGHKARLASTDQIFDEVTIERTQWEVRAEGRQS